MPPSGHESTRHHASAAHPEPAATVARAVDRLIDRVDKFVGEFVEFRGAVTTRLDAMHADSQRTQDWLKSITAQQNEQQTRLTVIESHVCPEKNAEDDDESESGDGVVFTLRRSHLWILGAFATLLGGGGVVGFVKLLSEWAAIPGAGAGQ